MANVASLQLCKELYKLSKWSEAEHIYGYAMDTGEWVVKTQTQHAAAMLGDIDSLEDVIPAYDLGYLLRKLPHYSKDGLHRLTLQPVANHGMWAASYDDSNRNENKFGVHGADTPENAVCKLAIELFKQKVLS